MNVLITGSAGFVGKNLIASLKNIRDGKDRTRPGLVIDAIMEYDVHTEPALLEEYCSKADFVFHLAGVNRPKDPKEFMEGNFGFSSTLLTTLKQCGNRCPIVLSSSIQAELDNEYGKSKKAGEELFFSYADQTGAKVMVYRFPNLFGKWCRPNYNSVIATFCHNMAHDLPIVVNNPETVLTLAYIDDVVAELLDALQSKEHRQGRFCCVPVTHQASLGQIVELLNAFCDQPRSLLMPQIPQGSFAQKLYSTYNSYLPAHKAISAFKMNIDARGSFTEVLKTADCGQFSVNISKPGITKGQHWHHSKWEIFMVVSGHGRIRMRKIDTDEVLEFDVSGEKLEAVRMLPGYTHSIINLSESENLVTLMWANEAFDPDKPDTYFLEV